MKFEGLNQDEILALKLKQLKVDISGSWVEPLIKQVFEELESFGLKWRPHIWVSNEWFCPDGVPGVAIPFYLLSKKLIKMEKENVGFIEGHTDISFLKLFRHEVGHAFDNAFKLRNKHLRQSIFGSSKLEYKKYYSPKKYSTSYVKHLPLNYAQAHPDEDFAETFAFVISGKHNKKFNQSLIVRKKINFILQSLDSAKRSRPKLNNKYKFEELNHDQRTLKSYYRQRRKDLNITNINTKDFLQSFSDDPSEYQASKYLLARMKEIKSEVAEHVGTRTYHLDEIVKDIYQNLNKKKLYITDENKAELEIKDLIVYQALNLNKINRFYF